MVVVRIERVFQKLCPKPVACIHAEYSAGAGRAVRRLTAQQQCPARCLGWNGTHGRLAPDKIK
jgi:hypothetical protein